MARKKKVEGDYDSLDKIPKLVFTDRMCTDSPCPEVRKWLRWMLENHRDDLYFLYRKSQRYKDYGGGWFMPFDKWLGRLQRSLDRQDKRMGAK